MGVAGEAFLHRRLRLFRHEAVLLRDMQHEGGGDVRRLVQHLLDSDAVIADIGVEIRPTGQHVGKLAAEAEADRADLAAAARHGAHMPGRRLQVVDALVHVEAPVELEGLLPFLVGPVGDVDARLLAPEEGGRHGDIALAGPVVGDIAHGVVDAEDLLDAEHARPRARSRHGAIGGELSRAVAGPDGDGLGHVRPPSRTAGPARRALEPMPARRSPKGCRPAPPP